MASLCVAALGIQSGFLILHPFSKNHITAAPSLLPPIRFQAKNEKAGIYLGRGQEFSGD